MARIMDKCMVKNPKISIVIAMYNIQSYIADCVKSCLHQEGVDKDAYEIIIVNDGSTDNSLSIAETAINGTNNARIINQSNAGVSVARNTGIDHARGEYIWFVDGDDLVEPYSIRTLIDEIEKTSCDIYIFNYRSFNQSGIVTSSDFERYDYPYSGKIINEEYGRVLPNLVWAAIYNHHFLKRHSLYYMPGIRHEDDEFTMRANYLADSIFILSNALYRYRISNIDSFMSKMKKDNTESFISLLKIRTSLNAFFEKKSSYYNTRRGHMSFILLTYRYSEAFNMDNRITYDSVKWELYFDVLRYGGFKRKIFVVLTICLPNKFIKKILEKADFL